MAYDKKGKALKVKGRWYGDHKYRRGRDFSPREFKVDSQFKLDGLYITLFTRQRRYNEEGRVSYVQIERNVQPTGIRVLDDFLRSLSKAIPMCLHSVSIMVLAPVTSTRSFSCSQAYVVSTSVRLTNCVWPTSCCAIFHSALLTSPVAAASALAPISTLPASAAYAPHPVTGA